MLPLFRCGLGGRLGSGRQWMSWISLDDAVAALRHAVEHASLRGPINVTGFVFRHPTLPGALRDALA
jgi:NAD dependent epimerase/dehydratase family enzyme